MFICHNLYLIHGDYVEQHGGSGDMLLAVYSDDGSGKPQYLRAVSEETAVNSTAGWQTIELIKPILAEKDTTIWLSWVFESNPGVRYIAGTPGRASSGQAWAYGMPVTFGSSTVDSYKYSICANYTVEDDAPQVTLIGNPYMYTARAYDIETGLYYYRARYYNPHIGRFLQVDPARQGMNWYAYCGNNPFNYTDPMGLLSIGGAGKYIKDVSSYIYTWSIIFASKAFDRPLVYVTVQYWNKENGNFETGKIETFYKQVSSKKDMFDFMLIQHSDPCNRIINLQITGHGIKGLPGTLLIQTDLSDKEKGFEILDKTSFGTEYIYYCRENNIQWTSSGLNDLIQSRFAYNAYILLGYCKSGGKDSFGFKLAELLPYGRIYGYSTDVLGISTSGIAKGQWLYIGVPYTFYNQRVKELEETEEPFGPIPGH